MPETPTVVPVASPADVYVLNTCTVTHVADKKSRQVLRQLGRANPEALLVATGCYAELAPEAAGALPGVDLVVGNDQKHRLVALVAERRSEETGVQGSRFKVQ